MLSGKIYPTAVISPRTDLIMNKDTFIGDFCLIACSRLTMLRGSQINAHSIVEGRGNVLIGEDAVVGYNVLLLTSTDSPQAEKMNDASPESKRKIITADIEIRDDAYIGSHTIIMPGVVVGRGAVVGAFTYLDKSIEPWAIGWGQPFEVKRKREIVKRD